MTEPTQRRRDLFAGIGLSATALVVAFAGGLITPTSWLTPTQSATVFPAACLLSVALCGIFIARGSAAGSDLGDSKPVNLRAVGVGILMAIYAIALPFVGLITSTVLLLLIVPPLFGYRNWTVTAIFSAILIGAAWFIFIDLMGVQLKL